MKIFLPKNFFSFSKSKIIFSSVFIFFSEIIFSQNNFQARDIQHPKSKYFQQHLDYVIDVSLDDTLHTLTGTEKINYTNNSPDVLSFIYVHLYPNAYSSQQSAFAKQFLRNGNTHFYFAKEAQMGAMNMTNASIGGQRLEIISEKNNPDIVKIILSKPLLTGETAVLDINFTEHFPDVFSRGGHIGQQYLATQWYPKPAVYDAIGWHLIPYLDQGEFYGEFGSFDVRITLPENYVVGATGTLQTESEKDFMSQLVSKSVSQLVSANKTTPPNDLTPPSSTKLKTIQFKADSIHDFAWFADKRFRVLKAEAHLKNGKTIPTYAYFREVDVPLWQHAAEYAARAVEYYSERIGDYPYAQATAVMQQSNGVGSGMEYPMITLIGDMPNAKSLDETITHEVGHNWFYGILGSNERDNGWMDEGFNTYYENGYSEKYYPKDTSKGFMLHFFTKNSDYSPTEIAIQKQNFLHRDQAPATTSDSLTELNYGLSVYAKTAASMRILEKYYGVNRFDSMMHRYFSAWQFKHPQPADVRSVFETATSNNLSWFFDGLIGSTRQVDYKISAVGKEVKIQNKGTLNVPFEISAVKNDSIVARKWFSETSNTAEINQWISEIRNPKSEIYKNVDALVVDADHIIPDVNRGNNYYKIKNNFFPTVPPLRLRFLGGLDNSKRTNIYVAPALAYNDYDGGMLGILLHNGTTPLKNFEWSLAPVYSFTQKQINGVADADYSFFSGKNRFTLGAGWKKFTDYQSPIYILDFNTVNSYQRWTVNLEMNLATAPLSNFSHTITFRHLFIQDRNKGYIQNLGKFDTTFNAQISELSYRGDVKNALGNTSWKLSAEFQSYKDFSQTTHQYLRPTLELKHNFVYAQDKSVYARVFAGALLFQNTTGYDYLGDKSRGSLGLVSRGFNDYKYDDYYIGRNEQNGFWAHQINPNNEGGMKFLLPTGSSTTLGFSNDFIFSVNAKADLPVDLPKFFNIRPYFDFGYFADNRNASIRNSATWLASGGLSWEIGDVLGVYVPLFYSGGSCADNPNGLNCLMQQRSGILDKVMFNLNIKTFNQIFKNQW